MSAPGGRDNVTKDVPGCSSTSSSSSRVSDSMTSTRHCLDATQSRPKCDQRQNPRIIQQLGSCHLSLLMPCCGRGSSSAASRRRAAAASSASLSVARSVAASRRSLGSTTSAPPARRSVGVVSVPRRPAPVVRGATATPTTRAQRVGAVLRARIIAARGRISALKKH